MSNRIHHRKTVQLQQTIVEKDLEILGLRKFSERQTALEFNLRGELHDTKAAVVAGDALIAGLEAEVVNLRAALETADAENASLRGILAAAHAAAEQLLPIDDEATGFLVEK